MGAEDKELSRPEHHTEGVGTHRAEGMETFEDPLTYPKLLWGSISLPTLQKCKSKTI